MKIRSITINHHTGKKSTDLPFNQKDIIATQTGSTYAGEWLTIWYKETEP